MYLLDIYDGLTCRGALRQVRLNDFPSMSHNVMLYLTCTNLIVASLLYHGVLQFAVIVVEQAFVAQSESQDKFDRVIIIAFGPATDQHVTVVCSYKGFVLP